VLPGIRYRAGHLLRLDQEGQLLHLVQVAPVCQLAR
jgi:hypothetical protein